ncbi:hypothetical protein CSH63_32895 [Micromonospora tulbaghiae]|uniref:Uncharacterized protein n=1 Tax=Micromonospora tulbaghiae TaxID=479978 RepID=A0A386WUK8_9ACTN|nr:hypothetical protein [Micromonospora tulbaghiae]AYF32155.1 hypothetical protein CSH63_32895 [Micromonospora tulbaghiae]
MSRQELAEAVNAWLYEHAGRRTYIASRYIGRLERGETRWPSAHYRTALRAVLNKFTDAELGFFVIQGHAKDPGKSMAGHAPAAGQPDAAVDICPASSPAVATAQSATPPGGLPVASAGAVAVGVSVGSGSVVWHEGSPGCITLVAGPLGVVVHLLGVGAGPVAAAPAGANADAAGKGARVYSLAERRAQ